MALGVLKSILQKVFDYSLISSLLPGISKYQIRGNKNCRSRIKRTEGGHGRRNNQESISSLPGRKLSDKKKKKKKKLRDEGGCSSAKRRIEKKCCSIETTRRLSMEHRRKKLKAK